MQVLLIIFVFKLVSCASSTQYYFDVNQLHEPLTNFDIISKTIKYCVYLNNNTLNNDYLIGTWYTVYKFGQFIAGLENDFCKVTEFSRPTKEDLGGYKAKYDLQNETFSFDDNAVISSTRQGYNRTIKGIVVGDKTAKYFFLEPKSTQLLMGMYDVLTFKPVNNDYLIYYQCSMRGNMKFLWSKKNNQTEEELESVIKPLYELKNMDHNRFCKKKKVVSTTPYF